MESTMNLSNTPSSTISLDKRESDGTFNGAAPTSDGTLKHILGSHSAGMGPYLKGIMTKLPPSTGRMTLSSIGMQHYNKSSDQKGFWSSIAKGIKDVAGIVKDVASTVGPISSAIGIINPEGIPGQMISEGVKESTNNVFDAPQTMIATKASAMQYASNVVQDTINKDFQISAVPEAGDTMHSRGEWGVSEFAQRPRVIGTFTWDNSQAQGAELFRQQMDRDWLAEENLQNGSVFNFAYYRYRCLEYTLQLNCNQFCAGFASMSWIGGSRYTDASDNFTRAVTSSRVDINASAMTQGSLIVPWCHNEPWIRQPHIPITGNFVVFCLAPFRTPENENSSIEIRVLMQVHGLEVNVPVPRSTYLTTVRRENEGFASSTMRKRRENLLTTADLIRNVRIADENDQVEKQGDISFPQQQEQRVMLYASTNAFQNFSVGMPLGTRAHRGRLAEELTQSTTDEMTVKVIAAKPGLSNTFQWARNQAPGTRLIVLNVGPENNTGANAAKTPVDYICKFGAFYRGSFCYRLQAAKSAFHTGKIVIVICPAEALPTLTAENYMDFEHFIFDLKEDNVVSFRVGYADSEFVRPTAVPSPIRAVLMVHTPLQSNASMVNTIDVLVWKWGHEGPKGAFQLFNMKQTGAEPVRDVEKQSGVASAMHEKTVADMMVLLTETEDMIDPPAQFEPITHLLQFLERPHRYTCSYTGSMNSYQFYGFTDPIISDMFWWIGQCFVFHQGGVQVIAPPRDGVSTVRINSTGVGSDFISINSIAPDHRVLNASNTATISDVPSMFRGTAANLKVGRTAPSPGFLTNFSSNAEVVHLRAGCNYRMFYWAGIPTPQSQIAEVETEVINTNMLEAQVTLAPQYQPENPLEQAFDYVEKQGNHGYNWFCDIPLNAENQHQIQLFEEIVERKGNFMATDPEDITWFEYDQMSMKAYTTVEELNTIRDYFSRQNLTYEVWRKVETEIMTTRDFFWDFWFNADSEIAYHNNTFGQDCACPNVLFEHSEEHLTTMKKKNRRLEEQLEECMSFFKEAVSVNDDVEKQGSVWEGVFFWQRPTTPPPPPPVQVVHTIATATGTESDSSFETISDGEVDSEPAIGKPLRSLAQDLRRRRYDVAPQSEPQSSKGFFAEIREVPASVNRIASAAESIQSQGLYGYLFGYEGSIPKSIQMILVDLVECIAINKPIKWMGLLVKLGIELGISDDIVSMVTAFLKTKAPTKVTPRQSPQGDTEKQYMDVKYISVLLSGFLLLFGAKMSGGMNIDEKKNQSVWEWASIRGRDISNMKNGINGIVAAVKGVSDTLYDGIFELFGDESWDLTQAKSDLKIGRALNRAAKHTAELVSLTNTKKIIYEKKLKDVFVELEHDMLYLLRNITVIPRDLRQAYNELNKQYQELKRRLISTWQSDPIRCDPFHVSVYGETAIGKSMLSNYLIECMAGSQHNDQENISYQRTQGMEFWDNYAGQEFLYIDDVDAINEQERSEEMIKLKANVPFILAMASLETKGMYFMSRGIVSTTNTPYPKNAVQHNDAYLRRRDLLCEVRWVEGKGRNRAMDHIQGRFVDPCNPTGSKTEWMSVTQLAAFMIIRYSEHLVNQNQLMAGELKRIEERKVYDYSNAPETALQFAIGKLNDRLDWAHRAKENVVFMTDPKLNEVEKQMTAEDTDSEEQGDNAGTRYDWRDDERQRQNAQRQYGEENIILDNPLGPLPTDIKVGQVWDSTKRHWNEKINPDEAVLHTLAGEISGLTHQLRAGYFSTGLRAYNTNMVGPKDVNTAIAVEAYRIGTEAALTPWLVVKRILYEVNLKVAQFMKATYDRMKIVVQEIFGGNLSIIIRLCVYAAVGYSAWYIMKGTWTSWSLGLHKPPEKSIRSHGSCKVNKESEVIPVQDYRHLDVPDDGDVYEHCHQCEKCEMYFMHKHKQHNAPKGKYPNVCNTCRTKLKESIIRASKNGDEIPLYPNDESRVDSVASVQQEGTSGYRSVEIRKHQKPKIGKESSEPTIEEVDWDAEARKSAKGPENIHKAPALQIDNVEKHGTSDPSSLAVAELVKKNMVTVWCGNRSVGGLGIRGFEMLCPTHVFGEVFNQRVWVFQIIREGHYYTMTCEKKNVHLYTSPLNDHYQDICRVDLRDNRCFNSFKDISGHIADMKDLNTALYGAGSLITRKNTQITEFNTTHLKKLDMVKNLTDSCDEAEKDFVMDYTWKYDMDSKKGDCGGVLLAVNTHVHHKIIGMHVAGSKSKSIGYAMVLFREYLGDLSQPATQVVPVEKQFLKREINLPAEEFNSKVEKGEEKALRLRFEGKITIIGELKDQYAINTGSKSKIKQSACFDQLFKHKEEPAVLSRHDARFKGDVWQTNASKFGFPSEVRPLRLRKISRRYKLKQLMKRCRQWHGPIRTFTLDEAINGIPGISEPLNMDSSPGWPYICERGRSSGKRHLFELYGTREDGSKLWKPNAQLQKDLDDIWEGLKIGEIRNNYYADWLKDELRPVEKIRIGKTRVFNVCNVAWLITLTRLYGAILAVIGDSEFELGNALGFDMHGSDPRDLMLYLGVAGPFMFDHDVEKWDAKAMLAEYQHDCYENWSKAMWTYELDLEMFNMRKHAMVSITSRVHVVLNIMYQVNTGMSSGVKTTSTGNSDVHDHTSNMIYTEIMEVADPEIASLEQKSTHARESKLGDDNIGAASGRAAKNYNALTICANFAKYGVTAVPPTKDGKIPIPYKSVKDVEFLKCKFRKQGLRWFAMMREDTMFRLTNWIRKSDNDLLQLTGNMEDAQRFAFGWGKPYFEGLTFRMNTWRTAHGMEPLELTFEELDEAHENQCLS